MFSNRPELRFTASSSLTLIRIFVHAINFVVGRVSLYLHGWLDQMGWDAERGVVVCWICGGEEIHSERL